MQLVLSALIGREESAVSSLGIPEVQSEVAVLVGGIVQELSVPEVGVAAEKLAASALLAIGSFKGSVIYRLDFEVPEDYKDRCPIFCSVASQDNFIGEVWCAGRVKHSDRIITGKRDFFELSCVAG